LCAYCSQGGCICPCVGCDPDEKLTREQIAGEVQTLLAGTQDAGKDVKLASSDSESRDSESSSDRKEPSSNSGKEPSSDSGKESSSDSSSDRKESSSNNGKQSSSNNGKESSSNNDD